MKIQSGTINSPISRKPESIIERCISENGDIAITHYEVLKQLIINNLNVSVIKCILETGRTHQIRVHLSSINHPLLGDELYGGNLDLINRQALHSNKICFYHPITQKLLEFEVQLCDDLLSIIQYNN